MERILDTVIIEGAEFTVVEKPATVYAGFKAVEPDESSYRRFQDHKDEIADATTPRTMICLSIHYKERNHGQDAKQALMHCRETTRKDQPAGIDVEESPACILIKCKSDEAAWKLVKKVTGEDNPKWHMAPLFGLTEALFCNEERGYALTPDFSGTFEIEYYNDDGVHYTALSVQKR